MKNFILFILFLAGPLTVFSQDIIHKKEGGRIQSKVVSIEDGTIFYQLYQTRDNSVKQIPVAEVSMIDYEEEGIVFNQDLTGPLINSDKDPTAGAQGTEEKEAPGIKKYDIIHNKNGTQVLSNIIEIKPSTVIYQPQGRPFEEEMKISQIDKIVYANGKVDRFSAPPGIQQPEDKYSTPLVDNNSKSQSDGIREKGMKRKEKRLINMDYDRSTLTLLSYDNGINNPETMGQIISHIKVPPKYNDHNLQIMQLPLDHNQKDIRESIKKRLDHNEISKKIIAQWFNYDETNGFNMQKIHERGAYDATDQEYYIASASKRGFAALRDAGIDLIAKSYILVLGFGQIKTMEQYYEETKTRKKNRIKNGFTGSVTAHMFKVDFDETTANHFFNEVWFDERSARGIGKIQKYQNMEIPLEFFAECTAVAEGWQYNPDYKLGSENQKTEEELLKEYTINAIDNVLIEMENQKEELRIKSPIVKTHPVQLKIGEKEGVKFDQRFFVYENKQDDNGSVYSDHVGVIRAKNISNNRHIASGDMETSTFYQVAGKPLDNQGMFVQQNNDLGFSLSSGYMYKLADYTEDPYFKTDKNTVLIRASYYPRNLWPKLLGKKSNWFKPGLFTSMYVYSDIIFHMENSERISYSAGIGNDMHFARNFYYSPYIGYGRDEIIEGESITKIGFLEGGMLLGSNITHNVSFNIHGKTLWYWNIKLLDTIFGTKTKTLSLAVNASIKVNF